HDETVERCTDGSGPLSGYDRASLRRLDAGRWFAEAFTGERVPLLGEALALVRDLGLGVNLELKPAGRSTTRQLVNAVRSELMAAAIPRERLLVSSFDEAALQASRACDRELLIGCLWSRLPPNWHALAGALGAVSIHCNWRHLTKRAAHLVKAAGLDLYCYTVNDPRAFLPCWEWGVDGIFTDRPQDFLSSDQTFGLD
ncbi:MAG TPA: glycerophosphodiester phosphodiesterase family protein, partial [Nitrococcus sp.]|nr:glycerophosphodiester phosphodiesterase family protein [Nitrococcus sp.]